MEKENTTINEYIKEFPEEIQKRLMEVYHIIKEVVPKETIEKISWRMPTFYLNGNLIHFAGFKHHIGLYPGAEAMIEFKDQLTEYKTSKGAIQLPLDKPIPVDLIKEIVKYRVKMNTKN